MHRILLTRPFVRWLRKSGLTEAALINAVDEMARGLIDADLGGNVLKKRIAVPGQGKSGSARTIVATNFGGTWFFLAGYNKNEQENIATDALKSLKEVAKKYLAYNNLDLDQQINIGELKEIPPCQRTN